MKILILGGTGMLGHRLWIDLSKKHNVIATVRKNHPKLTHLKSVENIDVNNFESIQNAIKSTRPDVVINCIGIIKQLDESKSHEISIFTNALLPHKLSTFCNINSIRFIHFSTDCVFDGKKKGGYLDSDLHTATDLYGRTKSLGEVGYLNNTLTLRTSIIGRELRGHKSLVDWFLLQNNKEIKGFGEAIFSGFPTSHIASIIDKYILSVPSLSGIYNLAANPISKFDLLELIKKEFNIAVDIKLDTALKIDRSLNASSLQRLIKYPIIPWEKLIKELNVDKELYL